MNLKIYKEPNPLKMFDKVSKLKKLLKPIKVTNDDLFINKLLEKPQEILSFLFEGYSIQDDDYENIHLNCIIKCNIDLKFGANFGNGACCWINGEKLNGETFDDTEDKKGLIDILENMYLPDKILFTEVELKQKVCGSESEFKYRL